MTSDSNRLCQISERTEAMLSIPFAWCFIPGGSMTLLDASNYGGTNGGICQINGFAIGKFMVTNGQYQAFVEHSNGFKSPQWWEYSPQAMQWREDHPHPTQPAFAGRDLLCTRVSWFDSMAFCNWLSAELDAAVRLPTEEEWQHAAVGDTNWPYPWGEDLDETRANYGKHIGQVSRGRGFPEGQSPFGVMDMIGNLWEWCLTIWGTGSIDLTSYSYRAFRGGAWNVSNPEYLRAIDRGEGHSPRGRLNDCGFRLTLQLP
jgi:formylglycine-generating enzyme required for sulfatase activity